MKKSLISILTVLAMMLSVVACEEKGNPENPDNPEQPAEPVALEDLLGAWQLETAELVTVDASGKEIDRREEVASPFEMVFEKDGKGFDYNPDSKEFREYIYTYADGVLTIKLDENPFHPFVFKVGMKDGKNLVLSLNLTEAGPTEASEGVTVYKVTTFSKMDKAPERPEKPSVTKDTILGKWGITLVSEKHYAPDGSVVYEVTEDHPEMDFMNHIFYDYEGGYCEYIGGGGGDGRDGFDFSYTFDPETMKLNMVAFKENLTYDVRFEEVDGEQMMFYEMRAEYSNGTDIITAVVSSSLKWICGVDDLEF